MVTEVAQSIETVFPDVLRMSAYAFGEPCAKEGLACPQPGLIGQIKFSGQARGEMFIAAPLAMARDLAANSLGLDLQDPSVDHYAVDAFMEFLNMLCGNVLTSWSGASSVFDLRPPEASPLKIEVWNCLLRNRKAHAFMVDNTHPVMVVFFQR